ncbi:hypothetical protein ACFFIX_06185 [Metabacillus herbersteinensis]|uniref:Uncharacterized protein n=1 Tax=Metabacillus herbersteinensis TaxID=283816 RepID=A0ABV6GBJ6_9BACI
MRILNYSFKKRGNIDFIFDQFPHSVVVFAPIKNYYFIRYVRWDERDPIVLRQDLAAMELEANKHLNCFDWYKRRKAFGK